MLRVVESAIDGSWLACERTAIPAWLRMLLRVMAALSSATSTSRIRELAAEMFSRALARLATVICSRFCTAPRSARALDTSLMQRDGIHPNAEAQALIAEFMHRQLMPLFDN